MPRTDAANHVRTASFIVGPWRHTTRKNKNMESGDDGSDGGDAGADASAGQRTTILTSAPLPPLAKKPAPDEEPDYDSAWDDEEADPDVEGAEDEEEIAAAEEEEEEDERGAKQGEEETKTLSGRGYLAFYSPSSSSSSPFLRAVSGHLVDAASMTAVGFSGIEIDPGDSGDLGAEVPRADACSFAAGDRLLALALFLKGGKKRGRGGGGAPCSSSSLPSAVVLALASGGDAATVEAPAPDPRGQGARRLLLAVAARGAASSAARGAASSAAEAAKDSSSPPPPPPSASSSLLSPPRGVKPPRLSFECGTLLAGADAEAYLRGLGVALPQASAAAATTGELIVNVGTFEASGAVFSESSGGGERDGDRVAAERLLRPHSATETPFSEPARLSPSDPGYDPDFDS